MKARQASDPPFPPEASTGPGGDGVEAGSPPGEPDTGLPEEFSLSPAQRLGAATINAAIARLGGMPARTERKLYRVVEVGRDGDGRLSRQGRIWHRDLDLVRRFGRALASNSVADRVVVSDSAGTVLETISTPAPGERPAGWSGWRQQPLPPLPAARRPARLPAPGAASSAASRAASRAARPPATPQAEQDLRAALDAALDAGLHAPRSAVNPAPPAAAGAASRPAGLPAPSPTAATPPQDIPSLDVESEVERTRTLLP